VLDHTVPSAVRLHDKNMGLSYTVDAQMRFKLERIFSVDLMIAVL
jgi:hypothetical protein